MNKADSDKLCSYLEFWGFSPVSTEREADIIILNTCVVRQKTEDRAIAKIRSLIPLKKAKPNITIALTGCLVVPQIEELKRRFPFIDLFFPPQAFSDFLSWAKERGLPIPEEVLPSNPPPSYFLPVIQGCDNFCSYCIVPYRRGREKSRPIDKIVCEVKELVRRGVKEVVLLGQNINSYGHDLPQKPDLADLLTEINKIEGLERIRFLTSHPRDINEKFIRTMARLEKVCPYISLPVQAGDNRILQDMRRGYTVEEYRQIVQKLREAMPEIGISTDVIVGFPGEGEEEFERTVKLIEELRFDTVHIACYSPRPGTLASRNFKDNIPSYEKKRRQRKLEAIQRKIAFEINSGYIGKEVEILVEGKSKGKWYGRTKNGKLVFFDGDGNLEGQLVKVMIKGANPWWLEGERKDVFYIHFGNSGN